MGERALAGGHRGSHFHSALIYLSGIDTITEKKERTPIDETHSDVELGQIKFAPIVNVRKSPKNQLNNQHIPCNVRNSPDLGQIVPIQPALPKDLQCSLTANEMGVLQIPGPEDLIILFLLRL